MTVTESGPISIDSIFPLDERIQIEKYLPHEQARINEALTLYGNLTAHIGNQAQQSPNEFGAWNMLREKLQFFQRSRSAAMKEDESYCLLIPPSAEDEDWVHRVNIELTKPGTGVALKDIALNLRRNGYRNAFLSHGSYTDLDVIGSLTKREEPLLYPRNSYPRGSIIYFPWLIDDEHNMSYHKYAGYGHLGLYKPDLWTRITETDNDDTLAFEWLIRPETYPRLVGREAFAIGMNGFFTTLDIVADSWREVLPIGTVLEQEDELIHIGHNED